MKTGSEDPNSQYFLEQLSPQLEAIFVNEKQSFIKDQRSFLHPLERNELGDITGKTILHLQCRSGLETLSLVKLGARVVGVDFDERAIQRAHSLVQETRLEAEFRRADIFELPQILNRTFDIVYTAYGVLFWLPDLKRWGQLIARYLAPGGMLYLVDYHPAANLLDEHYDARNPAPPRLRYAYEQGSSYRRLSEKLGRPPFEYRNAIVRNYGLGEVISALIDAGLHITYIREHEYMDFQRFEQMKADQEGRWRWRAAEYHVPLLFSLKAIHMPSTQASPRS